MASCLDVAQYILAKLKEKSCSAMKLQKLVYYCQAWSLVWDDKPIFGEKIEAWINGPVVPFLYDQHKGKCILTSADIQGSSDALSEIEKETIDAVLKYYGDKNAQWLSDLTHLEAPWIEARKKLKPQERGNEEITHQSMSEFYSSIPPENN